MFDLVTGNKRVVQVVLAIIILPFAFFGIDSYFRGNSEASEIVNINGESVSVSEFGQVLRSVQSSMQSQLKDNPEMQTYFNSNEFKRSVLDDLIQRRLMIMFAQETGLLVPDALIRKEILAIPAFHNEDGEFSEQRYTNLLRAQNLSPERFENEMRQGILLGKIENVILGDAFVSQSLSNRLNDIRTQQRIVTQHIFAPNDFILEQKVDDSSVKKFFDDNPSNFMMPARIKVQYVLLTPEVMSSLVEVTETNIQDLYESKIDEYTIPEQRKVRHILLAISSDMDENAVKQVEEKIVSLQSRLEKNPGLFAELANEFSDDPGSAELGGDLGFNEKGVMPQKFDDIVFELDLGKISPVIRTGYGYHIARVDQINKADVTPISKVREELSAELRKIKLFDEFAVAAENFGDMVYSQYDSLEPVADRFNLTLFESDWISESGNTGNPILDNTKFLSAIFSESSIQDRRNIEAIEIDTNQLVSARVVNHEKERLVDYSIVKDEIRKYLLNEQASAVAKEQGASALRALKDGATLDLKWSREETVSILERKGLHPEGLRAVFSADSFDLPSYAGLEADNGKYVIYKIIEVFDGSGEKDGVGQKALSELNSMIGQEQFKSFLAGLRESANVNINENYFNEQ